MKNIKELKIKMEKNYWKSRKYQNELSNKIKKYFDFEVDVTFCEGDGFLILDEETSCVFNFNVLWNRKKGTKLTRDDCFHYGI